MIKKCEKLMELDHPYLMRLDKIIDDGAMFAVNKMDIQRSIQYVNEISRDQIEQEGFAIEDREIEENRENNMLGQLGWKFESREELLDTVREFFSMQGYAISIKNSKKDQYVIIGCDREGRYRNKWQVPVERRQRKTATLLIGCPFEIQSKRHADGIWVLEVKNNTHNHEPSSDMSGHLSCRRLSREEIMSIKEMTRSGVSPRQILSSLRQRNPKLQAISKTIYDMKVKLRKEELGGRTMIQALFEELCQGKVLPLDAIHSQWRIDIVSFTCSNGGETSGDGFKRLIHELGDKYEMWPPNQKELAQERISQLVNPSIPLLFEPNVQSQKGCPLGSKKGKESGSTRRNPSKFEIVDATRRKCSICKDVGHNSQTCPKKFGTNDFNASPIGNPNDDGTTMDVTDLHTISTSSNCFWLE
ncbi:hypothetical protein Vadar_022945 [Vaccinium darrowii]|uniref:Uncharacterized protein n=1 Tax=Vaccinium darrowii TaxID=229202 RepID=A0ACB7X3G8_9ERIC|nr:hypothetical protein Vadar_022945 [Vaccinium darrowii]